MSCGCRRQTWVIAASIAPLPASFAIDGTQLRFDMGTRLLRTFARCVEPKEEPRGQLLDGEQPAAAATGLVCSELFAEIWGPENGIGARSAIGMGPLPGNIPVEIEVIFELH